MYKGNRSRFFPFVVLIIIVAIVVIGFVAIGRMIFGGGQGQQAPSEQSQLSSQLLATDSDRSVTMTVRGPIVGDENFRSYEMTISPSGRSIFTWQGYDRSKVIAEKQLPNDTKAYTEFVNALAYAGFTKTVQTDIDDTNGLCANGRVYTFSLATGVNTTNSRWTTNCGVKGSFDGNGPTVRQLFIKQIPDASEMIGDIEL